MKDPNYRAIFGTDLTKPASELIEGIRSQMSRLRGQLGDINRAYGWGDRLEDVEGLLTCGIVALACANEEIVKVEIMRDDEKRGRSLVFRPRGIGTDSVPCCFVCGEKTENNLYANVSAFVDSKEHGAEIVSWFGGRARLDWRDWEPNWIQVKAGVCEKHRAVLDKLYEKTSQYGRIRQKDIEECLTYEVASVTIAT